MKHKVTWNRWRIKHIAYLRRIRAAIVGIVAGGDGEIIGDVMDEVRNAIAVVGGGPVGEINPAVCTGVECVAGGVGDGLPCECQRCGGFVGVDGLRF